MSGWETVLAGLRELEPEKLTAAHLASNHPYVEVQRHNLSVTDATLDGAFTSRQLRAIAAWMDDPTGVAEAWATEQAREAQRHWNALTDEQRAELIQKAEARRSDV